MLLAALLILQGQGNAPYWQQRVGYRISARLDEPSQTLRGTEGVRYLNNSPDTLRTISFHLYLNAFRPGSRWSASDSVEHLRRFNHLKDPDYGFNHVSEVTIGGIAVQGAYPFGADSTIVRFQLPTPLAPGDSVDVAMNWDARTSIPPRRQGRRGRSYDFAQWFPKVVVYDKYGWEEHALTPAGEFYGEFGDFTVLLDTPEDQVVGATGVPVCGDPGWARVNRAGTPVNGGGSIGATVHVAEHGASETGATDCDLQAGFGSMHAVYKPAPGRKQVLWLAQNVHNFAISMSPDYRYEGGEWNGTQIHVLYQPGDEATWGNGIVVQNTVTTLRWLELIFGKYVWPQMTVVHRIEGGGSEAPMMQMNGSASQGLNVHEGGHSYVMGILANNEWKDGWLDEGFTSFQTTWFNEVQARNDGPTRGLEVGVLGNDLDNLSQPVATPADKFRDFSSYNDAIYSRGELFLQELRRLVGDQVMVEILRRYYARWQLRHVDEAAFKNVVEEVTHRDFSQFFAQWLHEVVLTDYAVHSAKRAAVGNTWRTTVRIDRKAPGQFPVTVAVYAARDTTYAIADGVEEQEEIVVTTQSKPWRVALDPFTIAHDWNMLNNQYTFRWLPQSIRGREQPTHLYFDHFFTQQVSRERLTVGLMPTLTYNTPGGVTLGLRSRSDYLGRFEQNTSWEACGLRHFDIHHRSQSCGYSITLGNPVWLRLPNTTEQITAFHFEGRVGAGVQVEQVKAAHADFGSTVTRGASLNWLATYDLTYLPGQLWDNGGSGEAAIWWGISGTRGAWALSFLAKDVGGVMYRNPGGGITTDKRYDAQWYSRPEITMTAKRLVGTSTTLSARAYAAGVFSGDPVLTQRRIFIAGADPYQSMSNAFVRSVGAPLLREDCWCRWHTPGDGNLRGFNQAFSTDRLATLNVEVQRNVYQSKMKLLSRVGLVLFGDGGYTGSARGIGGAGDSTALAEPSRWLGDAGIGLRLDHRIGTTSWTTRIDFPMLVSDPQWAFAHRLTVFGANRMVLSFSPVIR